MYSIILNGQRLDYEADLKNTDLIVDDLIINLIGFHRGYEDERYYLAEHPSSTRGNNPIYYSIPSIDKFCVFRHYKTCGYIFSEHIYEKLYTIKICKIPYKPIHDISYLSLISPAEKKARNWRKILKFDMSESVAKMPQIPQINEADENLEFAGSETLSTEDIVYPGIFRL